MIFSKKISANELGELRAINKLIKEQEYMFNKVAENSVMVYMGQKWLKTQGDIVKLMRQSQSNLISTLATKYGVKIGVHVTIDLATGKISADESKAIQKAPDVVQPADKSKK